jgi:hypothetical protein
MRLNVVLWDAQAIDVDQAKVVLGDIEALVGGFAVPFHGFGVVLGNAFAERIRNAKVELGRISLINAFAKPFGGPLSGRRRL